MASHRRTAAAALAVALASVSLYPIFIGWQWFWVGCGSAAVVALTGTATRLRRLPAAVAALAGVAALLLYLNVAFSNARSLGHVLPTSASLAALWHVAAQGFTEASRYAPPVPELRGLLLLAAGGIGIAALLTDLIAVRLGNAALAGLPLLLLFAEPFTVSVSRGFFGTTVAFGAGVAGYLALLSSEARERIRAWEQQDPAGGDAPDTRPLAAAGRRVGFASVVLAVCLPLFIPGLHVTRLFGGGQPGIGGSGGSGQGSAGAGGSGAVGFPDPNTQLSQELHTTKASTVLVYTSTEVSPDYLQIYALDKFTSAGFQLAQPGSLADVRPRLPAPPGLTPPAAATKATTHIVISPDVGRDYLAALPVPYPATAVTASGNLRAEPSTLMVFDTGVALGGLKYTVTSLSETPTAQSLDTAPAPPAAISAHYLSYPASYDALRPLAASIVAGAVTQFQRAVALQDYLASGAFRYTLQAPTVLTAAGLATFLTVTKKGYCQQFSFAMAALARLLGIPSRVAYGFTSGTQDTAGSWVVTTHDAHAWPELYFQGYGWLRFEPTPFGSAAGQGTAYAPGYAATPAPTLTSPSQPGASTPPSAAATGNLPVGDIPPNVRGLLGNDGTGTTGAGSGGGPASPWQVFGFVVAGLAVLAAVTPGLARRVVRRRRWARGSRRAGQGRTRDVAWAHAAWQELRDDLVDYGAGVRPSESPRTVASRASGALMLAEPAQAALQRIARAEERARYAPAPADGARLRADSVTVRRAIAAAVPRGARWRARLLPSSVLGLALSTATTTADRYRKARRAAVQRERGRLRWLRSSFPGREPGRRPRSGRERGGGALPPPLLAPAPVLVHPLPEGSRGSARAARAALADDGGRSRRGAHGDRGRLTPAVQRPDTAQQHDDETPDRQADYRQDDTDGDHGRTKSQADQGCCHPAPVVHAGIAGAN